MSISPEIRDQAYLFFIEEAPELLQILESGLLTLRQDRSTAKVHDLMRAAHSLKGGAASVGLDAIKTISHRLEDILKALYSDAVVLDTTLESLLLQAYDCLRLPLMEHIAMGDSDSELALATAEPIFAQLESQLGDAIAHTETFIPSSADLGIDMVFSIFDVDVGKGLERLQVVLSNPQDYEVAGELRAQAEVFQGFAELLDLPGFGSTAQAALRGLDTHPHEAILITRLALSDFQIARDAVLAGERDEVGGPSVELVALGDPTTAAIYDPTSAPIPDLISPALDWEKVEPALYSVDDADSFETVDILVESVSEEWDLPQSLDEDGLLAERISAASLSETEAIIASCEEELSTDAIPLIEDVFGESERLTECRNNLSSQAVDGDVPDDGAIADQLEGVDAIPEGISQTEFPLDSSIDFTLESANSKLDEIFGDLAAASDADEAYAAYAASEIESAEDVTDYVDIVIPDNNAIDQGCGGDQATLTAEALDLPQSLHEDSALEQISAASTPEKETLMTASEAEFSTESIPLIEDIFGDGELLMEGCEALSAPAVDIEVLTDEAISDQIEGEGDNDTPEFIPGREFSQDSQEEYTLESANSKLDEIFGDLAAVSEADSAYQAAEIDTTEEMTDYVDIVIPANGEFGGDSELDEQTLLDAAEEIADCIDIVIPDQTEFGADSKPDEQTTLNATEELTEYIDIVIPAHSEFGVGSEPDEQATLESTEEIAEYIDIVIPANSELDAYRESGEHNTLDSLDEAVISDPLETLTLTPHSPAQAPIESPETLAEALCSVEQIFESLPSIETAATLLPEAAAFPVSGTSPTTQDTPSSSDALASRTTPQAALIRQNDAAKQTPLASVADPRAPKLSVRVDLDRLGRMDNLLGELAINRNGLSLQNEQLQRSVRELVYRFTHFKRLTGFLQDRSDQMLIAPERHPSNSSSGADTNSKCETHISPTAADFDSLELDNYGALHGVMQELLEEVILLEESVGDVELFAGQSNQMLERQRQRMTQLRNELMWARMLPLGGVLNRFPRILRDLSATYHKPVELKISGGGVLVDKAVLEKLYTPLLHLLRNAFDHGIEGPETRLQQGKAEWGRIEIRAYHQGNTTVIEVRDDGRGLDLQKIGRRAVEVGLLSDAQLAVTDKKQLAEFIFSPGFSTASQVSELSGRGVGLDVVRSQLKSLKGTISVTPFPGQGTTFTLRLPLTLTIAKLLISLVGSTALAIPSDSIEEIVIPKADHVKRSGNQRLLYWQNELVPVYAVADLLDHAYPLPETLPSKALSAVPTPQNWALPMLVMRQDHTVFALEIERLVTEQELVIKPFSAVIPSPSYTYGCTILGDGALVPVIDGAALVDYALGQSSSAALTTIASEADASSILSEQSTPILDGAAAKKTLQGLSQMSTILVVDDSAALRRTLALTLQKAGYTVLQARDGKEALEQLQQNTTVKLIICDIEMPNMNGFEFLHQRRQDPHISNIPVAMLTSRGNPKHRRLAQHLGANQYFTKPYIEQTFLDEIRNMLEQQTSEAVPMFT